MFMVDAVEQQLFDAVKADITRDDFWSARTNSYKGQRIRDTLMSQAMLAFGALRCSVSVQQAGTNLYTVNVSSVDKRFLSGRYVVNVDGLA